MTDATSEYRMTRDGWAAGRWRARGETVRLRPAHAAHEPLLVPVADWRDGADGPDAAPPTPTPKRKPARRRRTTGGEDA